MSISSLPLCTGYPILHYILVLHLSYLSTHYRFCQFPLSRSLCSFRHPTPLTHVAFSPTITQSLAGPRSSHRMHAQFPAAAARHRCVQSGSLAARQVTARVCAVQSQMGQSNGSHQKLRICLIHSIEATKNHQHFQSSYDYTKIFSGRVSLTFCSVFQRICQHSVSTPIFYHAHQNDCIPHHTVPRTRVLFQSRAVWAARLSGRAAERGRAAAGRSTRYGRGGVSRLLLVSPCVPLTCSVFFCLYVFMFACFV